MNSTSWVSVVAGTFGNAFNSWMAYETAKIKGSYSSSNSVVSSSSNPVGVVSGSNTLIYIIIVLALLFIIKK